MKWEKEKKNISRLIQFVAQIITALTTRRLDNFLPKEQFTDY